jgi:hypothetical protein
VALPLCAQDLPEKAKQSLEEERRTRQLERSIQEQARTDALKPPARDPRACEGARINYQAHCGSSFAPRWRSPRCAEAEALLQQSC